MIVSRAMHHTTHLCAHAHTHDAHTLAFVLTLILHCLPVHVTPCSHHRHLYASLALSNVKVIASLISIPLPHAFSHGLPTLLAVSVALVVVMAVLTAAMYAWRGLQQLRVHRGQAVSSKAQGRRLAACVGVLNALQFGLAVWLMVMMAISMLWFGGGMVAAKATTDAVATMSVVDEMLPRLIKNAVGIDPKKEVGRGHGAGFMVVARNPVAAAAAAVGVGAATVASSVGVKAAAGAAAAAAAMGVGRRFSRVAACMLGTLEGHTQTGTNRQMGLCCAASMCATCCLQAVLARGVSCLA